MFLFNQKKYYKLQTRVSFLVLYKPTSATSNDNFVKMRLTGGNPKSQNLFFALFSQSLQLKQTRHKNKNLLFALHTDFSAKKHKIE